MMNLIFLSEINKKNIAKYYNWRYKRETVSIIQTCVQLSFDSRQVHGILDYVKVILEEHNANILKVAWFWKWPSQPQIHISTLYITTEQMSTSSFYIWAGGEYYYITENIYPQINNDS